MILPNKNITVFFKTGDKGVNYLMMRGKPIRPFDNGNQIGIKKLPPLHILIILQVKHKMVMTVYAGLMLADLN